MPRRQYGNQTEDLSPQERDLQHLLGLAQLHQLVTQPEVAQQNVDRESENDRVTAAIHLLGLQQAAEQHQAAIDEQTKLREESVKGNVTDALLSHVFNDPSTPLETKLDFAGRVSPEAAQMVKDRHNAMVASAIKNNTEGYQSLVKGGAKPETLAAFKTMNQIPDEAWDHIKSTLPTVDNTSPTDPTSTATKLGQLSRLSTLVSNPFGVGYLYAKGASGVAGAAAKNNNVSDFWNALIGKPQTAQ